VLELGYWNLRAFSELRRRRRRRRRRRNRGRT
jgi:hypothetical protein